MIDPVSNIRRCHGCEHCVKLAGGVWVCGLDGIGIVQHANSDQCEDDRFGSKINPIQTQLNSLGQPDNLPLVQIGHRSTAGTATRKPIKTANKAAAEPYTSWPRAHKFFARRRQAGDAGTGDVFLRFSTRSKAKNAVDGIKSLAKRMGLTLDCGCANRQKKWNEQYAFDGQEGRPTAR